MIIRDALDPRLVDAIRRLLWHPDRVSEDDRRMVSDYTKCFIHTLEGVSQQGRIPTAFNLHPIFENNPEATKNWTKTKDREKAQLKFDWDVNLEDSNEKG